MDRQKTIASACLIAALVTPPLLPPAHAANVLPAQLVASGCLVLPPGVQHQFLVVNNSIPQICQFRIIPMTGTGCPVIGSAATAGWTTTLFADGSALWAASPPPSNCVQTGTTGSGFGLNVAIYGQCCFYVEFMDSSGTVLYSTTFCCFCTDDLSVGAESWGRVKAMYR